ncbi:hypothetical protein AB0I91_05195 [Actinosynnema sp. NPDC049800]
MDDNGRMSTAYRRVLRRAARTPGHWAHGRSLGAVRAEVTRWIGAQARPDCVPPWDRVASLVHAAVHPTLAPEVLATARYLHGLVTGRETDDPRPSWLDPEVDDITTTMIGGLEWARNHGLAAPDDTPSDDAASDDTQADGETSPKPESSAYEMLWTVVRVHRDAEARIAELEHQVRELHEENARLSGDVTTWLGDYRPTIPDQDRGARRRPVVDRHLAPEEPARSFTYPLPAELPASHPTAG